MHGVTQLLRRCLVAALLAAAAPALVLLPSGEAQAQRDRRERMERPQRFYAPSHLSRDERQQLREDVESAQRDYDRREAYRGQRLGPEEREKLRQDIQDANRQLRRR